MIDESALKTEVGRLLDVLYNKRLAKLDGLKLGRLLDKNPYLYRAIGINDPTLLIDQLLVAFMSSSDETIFGNEFFEPLALWSARASTSQTNGPRSVTVGAGAGQDIAVETATAYLAISVKSGKNIFNSQSSKGQSSEFDALEARMKKLNKQFHRIIGYGYGRKQAKKASPVERLAGQRFWHLLTDEEDYFLRVSNAIGQFSANHALDFQQALDLKRNQILRQFMINFVSTDGVVDWDAVVSFNSSSQRKPKLVA